MFCRKCGKEIADNSEMCFYCGEIFVNNSMQNTNNYFGATYTKPQTEESTKSKLVGGLLGLFLGGLGIHNFYIGHTKKAIIQLSLTIVSFILMVAFFAIAIYGIMNSGIDLQSITEEEMNNEIMKYYAKYSFIFVLSYIISITVGVWAFIESILIFCGAVRDKDGKRLK